jgi:hypothetical protein
MIGVVVAGALLMAVVAAIIGSHRGRGGAGFCLGLILGPLGVFLTIFLTPTHEVLVSRERERLRVQDEARRPPAPPRTGACPVCAEGRKHETTADMQTHYTHRSDPPPPAGPSLLHRLLGAMGGDMTPPTRKEP